MRGSEELNYGQYSKTVYMHDGKMSQVVEAQTRNLIPASGTDIELVISEFKTALLEGMACGYLQTSVQVNFNKNKEIKLVKISCSRRVDGV